MTLGIRRIWRGLTMYALAWAVGVTAAAAQGGQITGAIRDQQTLQPLSAVQVFIQGTGIAAISGTNGSYTLSNVTAGTHTVVAQRIGYQTARSEVTLAAGATQRLDISMSPAVLSLQEVVATGLVDPVEGARSPISVRRVSREVMPVPVAGSALQNLQGMVAGVQINRTGGAPGEDASIMLRTPTSVSQSGAPLVVVDGVILGSGTTDIESMDIESIEVIRGAAAASLYGSRAAAGVIAITTNRGRGLAIGQTRFSMRSELGNSFTAPLPSFPTHHQYLVDNPTNPTTYVDAQGRPVSRANRVAPPSHQAFMDKPYPGGVVYDNINNLFTAGNFDSHNFTMSQNREDTNFAITLNRYNESGPLLNNDGYQRNSFRVNLDHRLSDRMSLGISAYHSRDEQDVVKGGFQTMLRSPPDIDLRLKDENGEFVRIPDAQVPFQNPLWVEASRDSTRERVRTLASSNIRWEPAYFLSVMANVSYDRQDAQTFGYLPKGTPASITTDIVSDGSITYTNALTDTWNAEAQTSLRHNFGALSARTTGRVLVERYGLQQNLLQGRNFFVQGVPRVNATGNKLGESLQEEVRALGYLWDNALDYDGKYIGTVLVRRDGSSLFGTENRWHNYYRLAGAYRLSEERWFNLPHVDEFKISLARGTAGGRPPFDAQYETWTASESGVSKGTLGNTNLRPEHTTETEASLESILFGRVGLNLTYAWQRTTDQLVQTGVPSFTGYSTQWQNVGTVSGNTFELTAEARVLQTQRMSWSSMFVFDRSRSWIEDWPIPCTSPIWMRLCTGVGIYDQYASIWMTGLDQLQQHRGGQVAAQANEFQVNDDGWVVWVGQGNTFRDGIAKNLWGTTTTIGSQRYTWGLPIFLANADGTIVRDKFADNNSYNFGWNNSVRYGQLSFHSHMQAQTGAEVINTLYWRGLLLFDLAPGMDQAGKADELKKPIQYYHTLEGGRGNSSLLSDGDYLKLRTLSIDYRLTPRQLSAIGLSRMGMESMSVGLVGRNLLTFTRCACPDPEQGRNLNVRTSTLTAEAGYPTSRTLTASVELTF